MVPIPRSIPRSGLQIAVSITPKRVTNQAHAMPVGIALGAVFFGLLFSCKSAPKVPPLDTHRIVALTPSATEVVAGVGATAELVGVDKYSEYPEAVRHLPKVGDFLRPDVESILALKPDIAVVDAIQTTARAKLEAAGITVVAIDMQTLGDARTALVRVGQALGRADAGNAAAADFDRRLARVAADARSRAAGRPRPRVLVIVDRQVGGLGSLYAAGPGTFLDEMLHFIGAENALAESPARYSQLAAEYVITLAPDIIIDASPAGAASLHDFDVLDSVPAVRTHRVYALVEPTLQAPGPRADEGARRLLPLVWP